MANSLKDKLAANAAIKGNGLDALLGNDRQAVDEPGGRWMPCG